MTVKLVPTVSYDARGNAYEVYRFALSNGDYLEVDALLADSTEKPIDFCTAEVKYAEEAIKSERSIAS